MSTKLEKAKTVTKIVAAVSVSVVVSRTIKHYAPADTNIQKIEVFVASFVLSGIACNRAETYAGDKFDEYVDAFEKIKNAAKEKPITDTV